jgi:hypothetical protein
VTREVLVSWVERHPSGRVRVHVLIDRVERQVITFAPGRFDDAALGVASSVAASLTPNPRARRRRR